MILFLITSGVFGFVILIMAVGVIVSDRQIKGSCGGLGGCELCLLKHGGKMECRGMSCELGGEGADEGDTSSCGSVVSSQRSGRRRGENNNH